MANHGQEFTVNQQEINRHRPEIYQKSTRNQAQIYRKSQLAAAVAVAGAAAAAAAATAAAAAAATAAADPPNQGCTTPLHNPSRVAFSENCSTFLFKFPTCFVRKSIGHQQVGLDLGKKSPRLLAQGVLDPDVAHLALAKWPWDVVPGR